MSKKLAIKGHSTRGKEVIKLLEMMGGEAIAAKGYDEHAIYVIPENGIIDARFAYQKHIDNYAIFTLEEFFEKYPFKVGDKVTDLKTDKIAEVYKIHWSENNSCIYYDIKYPNNCGCQRKLMDLKPVDDVHYISECKTIGQGTYAIKIADGYTFDSIDENGNIIVKSIKPKYPTTYDACCEMLNADEFVEYELVTNFPKLINARNAYWKIAGEQMGLDKPWEPDWSTETEIKYVIEVYRNNVRKNSQGYSNTLLAFPTAEMRDAFYDNFKDLIEQCKELL